MDDWNERIRRALVASQRSRTATIEGSEVVDVDGLVLCLSNLPDPSLNGGFVERDPTDPPSALEDAAEAAGTRGHTFGLFFREGGHPELEGAIKARGMRRLFGDPAMVAALADVIVPETPEGVELRETEVHDLPTIAEVDSEAFGTALDVSRALANPRLLGLSGLRLVQARLDGEPVGQAIAHEVDGTVGVFGVAVAERARRRGIGAAVTAEVVRSFDADFAWLFAKEAARSVYARIGFRPLSTWAVWIDER